MKLYNLLILSTYARTLLDNGGRRRPAGNRGARLRIGVMQPFSRARTRALGAFVLQVAAPLVPRALALLALLGSAACEAPDERPAEWGYVYPALLRPACTTSSCHSNASAAAGLDLSTAPAAYSYLLGRACQAPANPQDAFGNYVVPFQPERSRLLYLLRGDRTIIMPPDTPLPESEIAIVEQWILEGATCE